MQIKWQIFNLRREIGLSIGGHGWLQTRMVVELDV